MTVFRMSNLPHVGGCLIPIVASALNYESPKQQNTALLEYCTKLEDVIANRIQEQHPDITLRGYKTCKKCLVEFGDHRNGYHTEIVLNGIRCIGHIDRTVLFPMYEMVYPMEIKALGRFVYDKFVRELFDVYPEYESQEIAYLASLKNHGFYVVMNRDTGDFLKLIIENPVSKKPVPKLDGFTNIKLKNTVDDISSLIFVASTYIDQQILPEPVPNSSCRYCAYQFLCTAGNEEKEIEVITDEDVIEAAAQWINTKKVISDLEEIKDMSEQILLQYAIAKASKYRVGNLSVTYRGNRHNTYVDQTLLKELVDEEIVKQVIKNTKEFPDISIRELKGG